MTRGKAQLAVLATVALVSMACGEVIHRGDANGMINACQSHLGAAGVDFAESHAHQPRDSNFAAVSLRNSSGDQLGDCRVEVTRTTYRVERS